MCFVSELKVIGKVLLTEKAALIIDNVSVSLNCFLGKKYLFCYLKE